jgi:hypothetical protein
MSEYSRISAYDTIDRTAETYHKTHDSIFKTSKLEENILKQTIESERIKKMQELFASIGENWSLTVVEENTGWQDNTDVIVRTMGKKGLSAKWSVRIPHGTQVSLDGKGTYCFGKDVQGRKHIYIKVKLNNGAGGYIASEHLSINKEEAATEERKVEAKPKGEAATEERKVEAKPKGEAATEERKVEAKPKGEAATEERKVEAKPKGEAATEERKVEAKPKGEAATEERKVEAKPKGEAATEERKV